MDLFYTLTAPDGSVWAVPVSAIALNRARHYKCEHGDDLQRSLHEDTEPLFAQDHTAIGCWARENMQWEDVRDIAVCVRRPSPGWFWAQGEWDVVTSEQLKERA